MRLNHIVLSCSASESSLLWSLTKAEENKMYINNFWHLSHDTHNTNIFYNSFRYFLDHLHIKDKFLFLFMALNREISNITWFFLNAVVSCHYDLSFVCESCIYLNQIKIFFPSRVIIYETRLCGCWKKRFK